MWQYVVPVIAGLAVLGGIAFLVLRGSDETSQGPATPTPNTVAAPDTALVGTTAEAPEPTTPEPDTSDPVTSEPVTSDPPPATTTEPPTTDPPPTSAPAPPVVDGRSSADLEATLLSAFELGDGWTEIPYEPGTICTTDEFADEQVGFAARVFEQAPSAIEARQISQVTITYAAADTALGRQANAKGDVAGGVIHAAGAHDRAHAPGLIARAEGLLSF